jgi:DNA mismatch repair protein MutL
MFDKEPVSKINTFQLQNKYIINTVKSGMLIIDQNRAHQRILYEQLLQDLTVKEGTSQQLLFPLEITFSKPEMAILSELIPQLQQTGFMFDTIKESILTITGIPVSATETQIETILEQLIEDVQNEVPDSHFSQTDMLAKSLAKGLAIKSGSYLSQGEQEHLLNSLFACKDPNTAPSGLKTFTIFSVDDIQKKFN